MDSSGLALGEAEAPGVHHRGQDRVKGQAALPGGGGGGLQQPGGLRLDGDCRAVPGVGVEAADVALGPGAGPEGLQAVDLLLSGYQGGGGVAVVGRDGHEGVHGEKILGVAGSRTLGGGGLVRPAAAQEGPGQEKREKTFHSFPHVP